MTEEIVPALVASGLVTDHVAGDYEHTGFHHRYVAAAQSMPEIARLFAQRRFYLEMLTCIDLRQTQDRMRLAYTFNRYDASERHLVHVDLAPTFPWTGPPAPGKRAGAQTAGAAGEGAHATPLPAEAASIVSIFPAADWYEREAYDMFGVRFAGHPNLRRLLLPEDADFHALLKDFGRIEEAETKPVFPRRQQNPSAATNETAAADRAPAAAVEDRGPDAVP